MARWLAQTRSARPLLRPAESPLLSTPPRRFSSSYLTGRLRPLKLSPALQFGTLVTGAVTGSVAGTHARVRWLASSPLRCDEDSTARSPSLLERLQTLSLPDLPDPKSISSALSLPNISGTLAAWRDSLASVSTAFSNLQNELSLGPDSTYARILKDAENPDIHPEIQWDARVRLGRDLPHTERAFARNRRGRMRHDFARLLDVPVEEVDERDLPVVAIAASGGGYRAMINTTASLQAAKESGLLDTVTYISAVSGSCWALNTLLTIGGGDIDWTLRHLRERIKDPFLAPETLVKLFSVDDESSRLLLSAAILKHASRGGDLSLPDVYGTLVSSRLYATEPGTPTAEPPQPLSLAALKTSTQRQYMDDGSIPLPIYTTVRHDLPTPEELAKMTDGSEGGDNGDGVGKDAAAASEVASKATWTWFETTPYEVGSDKLGAFVPTWSLGRVFKDGKTTERVPELGVPVLSGIYASAFCASLFSYFLEIKPLLAALPYFSAIDDFGERVAILFPRTSTRLTHLIPDTVKTKAHKLDAIHPFPPAELPNFLYGLKAAESTRDIPKALTEARTLGFADAGVELNLPYVPLLRRSVDVIIALDSSADSHDVWFTRAAEYARMYDSELRAPREGPSAELAAGPSRWPVVDVESLFPEQVREAESARQERKAEEEAQGKDRSQAAQRVDQAKRQEKATVLEGSEQERGGVRAQNPQPTRLGSAPESRERGARASPAGRDREQDREAGLGQEGRHSTATDAPAAAKPMPESQTREPPLAKCSLWIGSTRAEDATTCRNDHPSVEQVAERDGIALAYIPLSPDPEFENPLEVFSTWKFDYTEDETDRLIRLAKGKSTLRLLAAKIVY